MNIPSTSEVVDRIKDLEFSMDENPNIDQGERALSVIAGTYLLFKGIGNIFKHPILGLVGTAGAGLLLYRGITGVCPIYKKLGKDTTDPQAINITERITVNAPRDAVYRFWRDLSNLPRFMQHLKSVETISDTESRWVANTPGNLIGLRWNASITREEDGYYIGWESIEGSMIDNAGKVEFKDALNGIDTELLVEFNYFPPAGSVGRGLASLFNGVFERMIREDILNFKNYAEQADFRKFAGLSETI
jgi:uncharacterized membrane protein